MTSAIKGILNGSFAACMLWTVGNAGCGTTTTTDVAYEDDYAADYYYPADVAYAGVYTAGWGGYAIYAVTPAGVGSAQPLAPAGVDATAAVDAGGRTGSTSGATTVRGAVGQAIRNAALGGTVCAGQVTVTPQSGTSVCGVTAAGANIVFNGCQLAGGGTVDGTVSVQIIRSASDANCNTSTNITLGYTSTITNLSYTGTGGAKIVIPSQMSTATINYTFGQTPTTISIATNGEVQRFASGGTTTSDRTYTGTHAFSSISLSDQSYTVDGMVNVTDKNGGTATITGVGIMRASSCCRPVGGTLAVSRTAGSHSGSHTWTFMSTCGSALLDSKTVTLPACL